MYINNSPINHGCLCHNSRTSYFKVETDPPGAAIILDDQFIGRSPTRGVEPPETLGHLYVIPAKLHGYQEGVATYDNYPPFPAIKDTFIRLQPIGDSTPPSSMPQQQQQTVIMPDTGSKESENKGTIIITSAPDIADVFVDGLFIGNSPTKVTLSDGIHIIEVKLDGYERFKRELRVLSGSEASIRATLEKN